jgi:hypothetical protein
MAQEMPPDIMSARMGDPREVHLWTLAGLQRPRARRSDPSKESEPHKHSSC